MKLFELNVHNYFLWFIGAMVMSGIFSDLRYKNTASAFGSIAFIAFLAWIFS